MPIDPRLTSTENYFQTTACRCQPEHLTVGVEDAIADDAAEIITEILRCIGSVKTF